MYHLKIPFVLCLVLSLPFIAYNQVVWTEPVFPKLGDEVTLYFDASQGTGELAGCNCDIYIHTGLITSESTHPGDWKNVQTAWAPTVNDDWKLTPVPGEEDLYTYTIGPDIETYYNVMAGPVVESLAFVFRNADGSKTGKDVGGLDIFYPVYPDNLPFTAVFITPNSSQVVVPEGETLTIRAASSENADLSLFDNGNLIGSTNGTLLEVDVTGDMPGTRELELIADNGIEVLTIAVSYVIPESDLPQMDPPAGTELGANFLGDTSMILALYAPNKSYVYAYGNFSDWALLADYQMRQATDGGTWWVQIDNLQPGATYLYQYLVDGQLKIADPYSTLILDPNNDGAIPEVTYPDIPEYPFGQTSGFVSVVEPGAAEYPWQITDFEPPAKERLTVYELLVRDFIARHDYTTLIDTLDYLENLGINAIELMPVQEFENNNSWGYNPSFHMALDKYYGPKEELKRFVDACHSRGIAVIVDVVYNHAFGQSPLVQLYFDGNPTAESPWFNQAATHPFNVGFDFNHESEATQYFVKRVMRYWIEEFKLDGFRFDLSKGFTQVNNPNDVGAWGNYDASRIAILKDYADECWSVDPDFYVILEHFANNIEEQELSDYGMMLWGNMHGAYTNTARGFADNLLAVSYKVRGFDQPGLVHYMESHDEERLLYSALQSGNTANQFHSVQDLFVALRRIELNSAFFYTVPGPKMLWQFGELGYDISINFNGRTGEKPILWEYFDEPDRARLYQVKSNLIHLRNNYEVFHTEDFDVNIGATSPYNKVKNIQLNSPDMNVYVMGNFDVFEVENEPEFQHTGMWYEYFSGDSLEVTENLAPILLTPSEYRLYTDVKLDEPIGGYLQTTGVEEQQLLQQLIQIHPNPVRLGSTISTWVPAADAVKIDLMSLDGRQVYRLFEGSTTGEFLALDLPKPAGSGTYLLRFDFGHSAVVKQVVLTP